MATLNAAEPHAQCDIIEAIRQDLQVATWRKAAAHFLGAGLEQGQPSFEPSDIVRSKLARLEAQEKLEAGTAKKNGVAPPLPLLPAGMRYAALEAVNSGGGSVGTRYNPCRACLRCGHPHEDARHRYYECPDNDCEEMVNSEKALTTTRWIGQQWSRPAGQTIEECLWGRGVLPAGRTSLFAISRGSDATIFGGCAEAARSSGVVYTDGSGGPSHLRGSQEGWGRGRQFRRGGQR